MNRKQKIALNKAVRRLRSIFPESRYISMDTEKTHEFWLNESGEQKALIDIDGNINYVPYVPW